MAPPRLLCGDMGHMQSARRLGKIFWTALVNCFGDRAPSSGAAIAYYTLFAMAPVLLVVIGVAGLIFGADAVRGEIVGQIAGLIGQEGAEAVQSILQKASEPREGIGATVLGTIGLVFAKALWEQNQPEAAREFLSNLLTESRN